MDELQGKGEYEYYEDGRIEKGLWVHNDKQGEFECYDQNGTLTYTKVYKDDTDSDSDDSHYI